MGGERNGSPHHDRCTAATFADVADPAVLAAEQSRVLELIAAGEPVDTCLTELCLSIERIDPRLRACATMLDRDRARFEHAVAPSIPGVREAIVGRALGEVPPIPCKHALAADGTVETHDLGADERWPREVRAMLIASGVRAGFSLPIIESSMPSAGTIFLGFDEAREPTEWDRRLALLGASVMRVLLRRERVDSDLRESEERSRRAQRAGRVGVWEYDASTGTTYWSDVTWSLFGRKPDPTVDPGDVFTLSVHPDDLARVQESAGRCMRGESPTFHAEFRIVLPDRSLRWIEAIGDVERNADGEPVRFVGVNIDVTSRRQAQDASRTVEARYRAIVEGQAEMVCRFRPDGTILFVNRAYARMRGTPVQALEGVNFWEFIPANEHAAVRAMLARITPDHPEVVIENRLHTERGIRWTRWTNRGVMFDEHGRPTEVQAVGVDITDRKETEGALRESESRFRAMANAAPVLIWIAGPDGKGTWFNQRWLDFVGRTIDEEVGDGWTTNIHPDDHARALEVYRGAIQQREPFMTEYRLRRHDGEYRWMLDNGVPLYDGAGRFTGFIGSCVDLHDRRETEDALRESEARFRALADAMPQLVFSARSDGAIIYYNSRAQRYQGIERRPDGTWDWSKLVHPDDLEYTRETWFEAVRTGRPYDVKNRVRAEGEFRWHLSRAHRIGEGDEALWFGTATDIHDLKVAEERLRESETRFRALADNMSQMAWIARPDGNRTWYNRRWYDFTGAEPGDAEGMGWQDFYHPDHAERALANWERAIATGEPWEEICPLRGRNGNYRWFLTHAVPVRDDQGNITMWFGTKTDITEQRQIEQELSQHNQELERRVADRTRRLQETFERLRLSERMAMMGTLSAGLGHDLGNLLVPVRVRLESLHQENLTDSAREDVEAIRTSAEYLRKLANGLRLLAIDPTRSSPREATDIGEWWSEAAAIFRSVLPRGVMLHASLPEESAHVSISKAALTQVVFNLVQNAGDALRDRQSGVVRIEGLRDGDRFVLTVVDNGPGMTPEVQARCMEPFFTTKTRGVSTGLGLALVYGLVNDAGGEVTLRTAPGQGATFELALPVSSHAERDAAFACVMLADPRVRSFVSGELAALGVEVREDEGDLADASIVVTDDPGLGGAVERAHVVLLSDEPTDTGAKRTRLPGRPRFADLREAIRTVYEVSRTGGNLEGGTQ